MRRRLLALAMAVALSLPVLPAQAQEAHPLAVVLVGGYGSDFDEASGQFSALRAAILDRSPDAVVVQYSYAGTSFDGCSASPTPYARAATAQDVETSKQILRDTVAGLESDCDVVRVAIVGHSLGGLIAFQTADGTSLPKVSDVVTVDSPLGGVPQRLVETCISLGFCVDGAVADYLATLYPRSAAIAQDNAAHVAALIGRWHPRQRLGKRERLLLRCGVVRVLRARGVWRARRAGHPVAWHAGQRAQGVSGGAWARGHRD